MTAVHPFSNLITTENDLRAIIGHPSQLVIDKALPKLDRYSAGFIARSPFALVATSNASGRCDVSPRGDGEGFTRIVDDTTLLIPDRPGNRRIDTLTNILENPHVGLIYMIPTMEETLRVNGRARIISDEAEMASLAHRGKQPLVAIVVDIDEVFFHCAKAFRRSNLWKPETWRDTSDMPSLAEIVVNQLNMKETTVEQLSCDFEEAYRTRLY